MKPGNLFRLCASLMLVASGALVSAQLLPSAPPKQFGASITPAFEGWYNNADGTHSFLIGYFSRNTKEEVDVPLGPNNHFEPGNPDMGQPTHFQTGRRYGMFTFTMPKAFPASQKITWVLNVNGVRTSVPFYMSPDYNVSPFQSSEESAGGGYNLPPVLRFVEKGPSITGPVASLAQGLSRTAKVDVPLTFDLWADDDARATAGTSTPARGGAGQRVTLTLAKYRGPGAVTFGDPRPKFDTLKGDKPNEAYSGKASTTVTFSEPGDYMVHVTANDYSGNGGGGTVCCWTNAIVKVAVGGTNPAKSTGQD